jgi:hypothetical protein
VKRALATVFGLLAASIVPAAYLSTAFPLSGERDVESILKSFFVFYFFSATATAILGIPTLLVLSKLKLVTWWSAVCTGACVGMIALGALVSSVDVSTLFGFAMLGGAAGFIFWIFWRVGRT